jgi:hypothetical protein
MTPATITKFTDSEVHTATLLRTRQRDGREAVSLSMICATVRLAPRWKRQAFELLENGHVQLANLLLLELMNALGCDAEVPPPSGKPTLLQGFDDFYAC